MFAMPDLRVGDPVRHGRLAVFPLFPAAETTPSAGYCLSDEALATGTALVEEVSDGGSVPHLAVTVTAPDPVLFLEGEELRGAKQNRVLNTSVLVPGNAKTVVPVSCVESGRWRHVSAAFGSAGTHASYKLRSVLKSSVGDSARAGRGHGSDQGAVWGEVSRQMGSLGSSSPTAAMSDTYEQHRGTLAEYRANLPYPSGAVGLAAAVGGRVVALDVFDAPATCEKVWGRLLTGLALDAAEGGADAGAPDAAAAVAAFRSGPWAAVAAAGAGEEYRSDPNGGAWHGSALSLGGRLLHGSLVLAG